MVETMRFEILDQIKEGTRGVVKIVRTTKSYPEGSGKLLVLKFPKGEAGEAELMIEYMILTVVDHPNVIKMMEYQPMGEAPYLALEYANAKCLINYLDNLQQQHSFNNEMWSRFYFKQVMQGLQATRNSNFTHLDVKVDNILMKLSLADDDIATG